MNLEYIHAAAVCLVFLVLIYGIGMGLYQGFKPTHLNQSPELPPLLVAFFQLSLGLAASIGLLALLAIVHGLVPWAVLVVLCTAAAAGAGLAWRHHRSQSKPNAHPREKWKNQSWADALVLACLGGGLLLQSSHAPGHWDDISYHLPMARLFVEHQGLTVSEYLRFPFFPSNMQLLMAGGLMFSGDTLAQMMATLPVFITCLGLMGMAQWLLGASFWGALAILLYLVTPVVGQTLGFAYVDAGLTLFCVAALFAVAVWYQQAQGEMRWLVLAGLFAGIAGGIKFHGLVFAALIGLVVLCVGKRWRPIWLYGLACTVTAGGWYLRSYWLSGDPVHPVGGSVFGHYLWSAADLASQKGEQAAHGVPKNALYFFGAFSHVQAYVVWFALPAMALLWRGPRALPVLWAVMVLYGVFWFFVSQVDRYLLPMLPVACFLVAAALHRLASMSGGMRLASTKAVPWLMAGVAVVLLGWKVERWSHQPSLQAQLQAQPIYLLAQKANEVAPEFGTRMVNVGFENARYYYQGELLGDWFGKIRYEEFVFYDQSSWNMRPAAEVAQNMQQLNANLLLVHPVIQWDKAQYAEAFELLKTEGPGHLYARKNTAAR